MTLLEIWVPTIVAAGALGFIWYDIKSVRSQLSDKMSKLSEKENQLLKKTDHDILCENANLKIQKHVTKEITGLKDDIFAKLRVLEELVKYGTNNR